MKKFNKDIGNLGEHIAKDYLINNGYKILNMNFKCFLGEIDIIVKKENIICFVEVKSRYFNNFGSPMESVTFKKQRIISKVASYYIQKYNLKDFFFSFDVIEVFFEISSNYYKINHIKNAFS